MSIDFAEFYHERAAIGQYEGGLDKDHAEYIAELETMRCWLASLPRAWKLWEGVEQQIKVSV